MKKSEPEVPTMVSPVLEPPPSKPLRVPPEELEDDIVALPLQSPDFANDVQSYLVNQNLAPRWIFTDRRRYAQAKAQGWRNCTKADLKPGYASLTPYEEEGGSKYLNGDLILMLIDRKRYLGALRYKHQMAERLARPAVQRAVSMNKANLDMGEAVNAINRQRQAHGQPPVMEVFDPHEESVFDMDATREASRLGHGMPDFGRAADLKKEG